MKIKFDPKSHSYTTPSGKKLLSVTRVLNHAGLNGGDFYAGEDDYLTRGTVIHEATAKYDAGDKVDLRRIPKRWRGHYHAWIRFRLETGFVPILIEHPVASERDDFAGCFDRLGTFPADEHRVQWLVDIKNAKTGGPADWIRYQLVGYGRAYNPNRMFGRLAVTLRADGTYKPKEFPLKDWHLDLEVFLRAAREANRGKRFLDFNKAKPRDRRVA